MLQLLPGQRAVLLSLVVLLTTAVACHAQDGGVGSAEMLVNKISELRLFLTNKPGVVRGEIATVGMQPITKLSVAMEEGSVEFRDDGIGPDLVKGDGVFTAHFKFDTVGEFLTLLPDLRAGIEILNGQNKTSLIRRGPRDIVMAADAVRDAESSMPGLLEEARKNEKFTSRMLGFKDPLVAARILGIDIATTPFLSLPGPQVDQLPQRRFRVPYLFNFPVLAKFPPSLPFSIDYERSLLINAIGVVEDPKRSFDACTGKGTPGGAWSFGYLMRELAYGTGLTPEQFTLNWLSSWEQDQVINGWPVLKREGQDNQLKELRDTWQKLSQLSPSKRPYDIDYFPARLLAIVNRPDLADGVGYGSAESAGEGRLVFGLVVSDDDGSCIPVSFTIIFEYGIHANSCAGVKAWQRRWKDLDRYVLGSRDDKYNQALEQITRSFTDHGSNASQIPNTSALSQLRTNENMLGLGDWQWREFRLLGTGSLGLVTVKQTPDDSFNGNPDLGTYLSSEEIDILYDRYVVPDYHPVTRGPFLGGAASTNLLSFFWSAPNVGTLRWPAETRRKFSLGTCNGCHTGETGTDFAHIGDQGRRWMNPEPEPQPPDEPARLSGFLQGEDVSVPQNGGTHHYEDLTERKIDMYLLIARPCFELLGFKRLPFVH